MSKINLEGIASKMSANQMKNVTGGCAPRPPGLVRCVCDNGIIIFI